jgi:RNA polymerase sigma-70 factor, ECF subfamily
VEANLVTHEQLRGDPAAVVTALFERYRSPICAYLYSLTDDWELAHDLTQECFLSAYRARGQLTQVENQRAWLYRVASNLAFNALKRKRRFQWLPWTTRDSAEVPQPDPSEHIAETSAVEQAMAALPLDYRAPLLLFSYYNFSIREVAGALGISEGAVKVRLHRAREMFRQSYGNAEVGVRSEM